MTNEPAEASSGFPGADRRPLLVTGSHRSGTTWAGKMLAHSGTLGYIHEPFLPSRAPGWLSEPMPYWYMYICADNDHLYRSALERVVNLRFPVRASLARTRTLRQLALQIPEWVKTIDYRRRRLRPLLKDPLALFSAPWLADVFEAQVVVMIRHPVAFVGSIKKLNWGFDYERNWLAQELLMRDLLGHRAHEYLGYRGEVDLVGEGIVMWNSIYDVVSRFRRERPEWQFVKYEDAAKEPLAAFESLYRALELPWTPEAADAIRNDTHAGNPKDVSRGRRRQVRRNSRAATATWSRRLTDDEVKRVAEETTEVAARFYEPDELTRP
ncbi:MAG TPA: sulfotransferase [Actinomycetota bacterium]|nr:sulfotransferase [Actinomycetota bacterium]